MQTMKVKPWAEGQGDYVVINADDFDAAVHEALDPVESATGAAEAVSHPSDDAHVAPARRGRKAKAE